MDLTSLKRGLPSPGSPPMRDRLSPVSPERKSRTRRDEDELKIRRGMYDIYPKKPAIYRRKTYSSDMFVPFLSLINDFERDRGEILEEFAEEDREDASEIFDYLEDSPYYQLIRNSSKMNFQDRLNAYHGLIRFMASLGLNVRDTENINPILISAAEMNNNAYIQALLDIGATDTGVLEKYLILDPAVMISDEGEENRNFLTGLINQGRIKLSVGSEAAKEIYFNALFESLEREEFTSGAWWMVDVLNKAGQTPKRLFYNTRRR